MSVSYYSVNEGSGIPKYQQLIKSLEQAIDDGKLEKGDKIASINEVCMRFKLSRDTVLMAYNRLKSKGIIESVPGKGYYVSSVNTGIKHKVFVLFDELNAFKEHLYNSFIEGMKGKADVDLYFHNFNSKVFKSLIRSNMGVYTSYVIMPANLKNVASVINELDDKSVYILDQTNNLLEKKYPGVVQSFNVDIYNALESGEDLLDKYNKLVLVFPGGKEPNGQKNGFISFCEEKNRSYEVITTLDNREILKGEVYIMPNDNDLVRLIKMAKNKLLKIGEDIGVVSYNDTPLKEVVCDGVTTISTNFEVMGKSMAQMILNNERVLKINPSMLIRRESL